MAFENKTIKEVYDTVVRGFESEFNTQFRLLPNLLFMLLLRLLPVCISLYTRLQHGFSCRFSRTLPAMKLLIFLARKSIRWLNGENLLVLVSLTVRLPGAVKLL